MNTWGSSWGTSSAWGGSWGADAAVGPSTSSGGGGGRGYRHFGYVEERLKEKKKPVIEIAVENKEIKYVAVQPQPAIGPSMEPIMEAVAEVTRLLEARARNAVIMERLDELEEEEDIRIIVRQLQ